MDWTTIVITIIGGIVTILTIVLPITLNRSQKLSRELSSKDSEEIKSKMTSVENEIGFIKTDVCSLRACIDGVYKAINESQITTQGLQLLDIIEHRPHCWETIRQIYKAYDDAGGNGHVRRVYKDWENDYGCYYDLGQVPPKMYPSASL